MDTSDSQNVLREKERRAVMIFCLECCFNVNDQCTHSSNIKEESNYYCDGTKKYLDKQSTLNEFNDCKNFKRLGVFRKAWRGFVSDRSLW